MVYLNGAFLPPDEARISPFDRGFLFADGVYEVIPAYGGRLFRMPQHLARLDASLASIRLANPLSHTTWRDVCLQLIGTAAEHHPPDTDFSVYLQVTRGPAPRDHAFPAAVQPTVFAYAAPIKYPDPAQIDQGVAAITVPDIRWLRCDIKSIALLANVLARQQAIEHRTAEAILLRDGLMTEGSASNIFAVIEDQLVTPPKGTFILPGVTRDLVLDLARAHDVPCAEHDIPEDQLRNASELMLSSSTKELLPITRLDDKPVANGRPGPVHARLHALYQEYKRAFRAGTTD